MTDITSFSGEYRWLSNFWPCKLPKMYGITPPTAEHAYQASKTGDEWYAKEILCAPTAGAAKQLGKGAKLQEGWDGMKLDVMVQIIRYKFDHHNPELRTKLLMTGDWQLIEGNTWGDEFWGQVYRDGAWFGHNHLGKILMGVRAEIRQQYGTAFDVEAPASGKRGLHTPVFRTGQPAITRSGERITIVSEKRDPGGWYDCVEGSDGIWRYDRYGDVGRCTGQNDPNCPHDLIYGALGS